MATNPTATVSIWDRLAAALAHLLLGVNNGANISTTQVADIQATIDQLRTIEASDVTSIRSEFATDEAGTTALEARIAAIEDGLQRITNLVEGFNPPLPTATVAGTTGAQSTVTQDKAP